MNHLALASTHYSQSVAIQIIMKCLKSKLSFLLAVRSLPFDNVFVFLSINIPWFRDGKMCVFKKFESTEANAILKCADKSLRRVPVSSM